MRAMTRRSPGTRASGAILLWLLGVGCGSSDPEGGAGTGGRGAGGDPVPGGIVGAGGAAGTGGVASGSGGTLAGPGGRTSGGSSNNGTGGRTARGTGGTVSSGGRAGGGGGAGQAGAGGTAAPADAGAVETGRDLGPSVKRDTALERPATQADSSPQADPDSGCVPDYACKPLAPNTGDPYADCVARVNQFRACVCLPPLARWTDGEACADQDAQYDSEQGTAHAGAQANICEWGNAQNECPDWKRATPASVIDGCLKMMFDEGPPPSSSCTGQCYQDHGHYINMTGTKFKAGVACGFYTTASGSVWAVQNFR